MLTKIVVLAAAFAATAAHAADCSGSELLKYRSLLNTPNFNDCKTATGFAFWQPTGQPDDAQLTLMCKSTACVSLVASLGTFSPSDCTLALNDKSINILTLTSSFTSDCVRLGASTGPVDTPAPTTTAPAPVTTAPAPVTTAPAPVTTAPAPATTAPAPVTTAPAPVTTAPAPVTTAPAPVTTAPAPTTVTPVPTTKRPAC